MNLLIIPDIFGATPAVADLARDLSESLTSAAPPLPQVRIDILDPYDNGTWFENEAEAYKYFTAHLGIPAYAAKLGRYLADSPAPRILLAFSAGTSAVWHLAGTEACPGVIGAVGFYGSQIRHDAHLVPCVDIHLVFPESEPHFKVKDLTAVLADTPRTSHETAPGGHGFMNRFSDHFDEGLYDTYIRTLLPDRLIPMMTQAS